MTEHLQRHAFRISDLPSDERPRERPSARLVGPGHEPAAEVAVEAEELLSGADGHVAEDSLAAGHDSAPVL